MKVSEALEKARALIAQGWTKGSFARDASGIARNARSHSAVSFCAIGALIHAVTPSDYFQSLECEDLLDQALPDGYEEGIICYNDAEGRTQEDILALYDRAIARAKEVEAGNE